MKDSCETLFISSITIQKRGFIGAITRTIVIATNSELTEKATMNVTDSKGTTTKRSLRSPGHCSTEMEVENNTQDPFWDTENDHQRLRPNFCPVDRNFDYDMTSHEDDPDDSDFCL